MPAINYRQCANRSGKYLAQLDERRLWENLELRAEQLAKNPGRHSASVNRQLTAGAAAGLLSVLTVANNIIISEPHSVRPTPRGSGTFPISGTEKNNRSQLSKSTPSFPAVNSADSAMLRRNALLAGHLAGASFASQGASLRKVRETDNTEVESQQTGALQDSGTQPEGRRNLVVRLQDYFHAANLSREIKEKLLADIAKHLLPNHDMATHKHRHSKIIAVARVIIEAEGLYADSPLTEHDAEKVIRGWVITEVLGKTSDKYVAEFLQNIRISGAVTLENLIWLLSFQGLEANGVIDTGELTKKQARDIEQLWHYCTEKEMPYIVFASSDETLLRLAPEEIDFASYYSGARYISQSGGNLSEYRKEDVLRVGEAIWNKGMAHGVSLHQLEYFFTPALFHREVMSPGIIDMRSSDINLPEKMAIVFSYLELRKALAERNAEVASLVENYQRAVNAWMPMGKLVDKIVTDCVGDLPDIQGHPDIIPSVKLLKRQKYFHGINKPCPEAPDTLPGEFKRLTTMVAWHYGELIKDIIIPVLGYHAEADFIFSPDAILCPVEVNSTASRSVVIATPEGVPYHMEVIKPIGLDASVMIFNVTHKNGEQRFYALKKNQGMNFSLSRIENDLSYFISQHLFSYNSEADGYLKGFSLQVVNEKYVMNKHEERDRFFEYLKHEYQGKLYNRLYKEGYEAPDLQKAWDAIKGFIPFYDCVEGSVNGNAEQAVPACLTDIVGLIPGVPGMTKAVYKGVKEGFKSSNILVRKMPGVVFHKDDISKVLPQPGNKKLKQHDNITAFKSNALLSHKALATIAGSDVPAKVAAPTGIKVKDYLKKIDGEFISDINSMKRVTEQLSQGRLVLTQGEHSLARFSHGGTPVLVKKMGEVEGTHYCVIINPETGKAYGHLYQLTTDNLIKPLSEPTRKRLQRILNNGMSGRGAGSAVAGWEKKEAQLEKFITSDLYVNPGDASKLTLAASGIIKDESGNSYIKINEHYIRAEREGSHYFVRTRENNKIFVHYAHDRFLVDHLVLHDGLLTVTSKQYADDLALQSTSGLVLKSDLIFNAAWSLPEVRIKTRAITEAHSVGSEISMTFKFIYTASIFRRKFIDLPRLKWLEKIVVQENNQVWELVRDMYAYHPRSKTFTSSRARYIEAYHYARAKDKNSFNGLVKILDKNNRPLRPNDLPDIADNQPAEKARAVRDYLRKHGGALELTVTDLPQLRITEAAIRKRLINFDIRYDDIPIAQFSQLLAIRDKKQITGIVTTSKQNRLIDGSEKVEPPGHYAMTRDDSLSPGEFLKR